MINDDTGKMLIFLFLVFCGLWQWLGPKPKYPHPPGSVLYVIQRDCSYDTHYETDEMLCRMDKTDKWLKSHPKSEWYWSEYSND
jgi:hypothetical protein